MGIQFFGNYINQRGFARTIVAIKDSYRLKLQFGNLPLQQHIKRIQGGITGAFCKVILKKAVSCSCVKRLKLLSIAAIISPLAFMITQEKPV